MQISKENLQHHAKDSFKSKEKPKKPFKSKKAKQKFAYFLQHPLVEISNYDANLEEDSLALIEYSQPIKKYPQKPIKEADPDGEDSRSDKYCNTELPKAFNSMFGSVEDFKNFFSKRSPQILEFAQLFEEIEEFNNIDELNREICPEITNCINSEFLKLPPDEPSDKILSSFQNNLQFKARETKEKMMSSFKKPFESIEDFLAQILRVYTMETFLYRNLNQYLRDENWTEISNLLPYAFCLCKAFSNPKFVSNAKELGLESSCFTLYRGTTLNSEAISSFDPTILKYFSWYAVTSATTRRDVLPKFMNGTEQDVIFIIEIPKINSNKQDYLRYLDVSKYSYFSTEGEFLLPPGSVFELVKVEKNQTTEITIRLNDDMKSFIRAGARLPGAMHRVMMTEQEAKIMCCEGEVLCNELRSLRGNILSEQVEFYLCTFDNISLREMMRILPTMKSLKMLKFISCSQKVQEEEISIEKNESMDLKIEICEIANCYKILNFFKPWCNSVKSLSINFAIFKTMTDQELKTFCSEVLQNLPQLTSLSIDFSNCLISDLGITLLSKRGLKKLHHLTSLNLNFTNCKKTTDEGIKLLASEGLKHLENLTHLSLNFSNCPKISNEGVKSLYFEGIKRLLQLKFLTLNFSLCRKITNQAYKYFSSEIPERIPDLKLNWKASRSISSFDDFSEDSGLEKIPPRYAFACQRTVNAIPKKLSSSQNFNLKTINNSTKSQEQSIKWLCDSLPNMESYDSKKAQESISFQNSDQQSICDFHYSAPDPGLDVTNENIDINSSTKDHIHLTSLTINFKRFTNPTNQELSNLAGAFQHLTHFASLNLNFSECSNLKDKEISKLCSKVLKHRPQLTSLNICFDGCNLTNAGLQKISSEGLKNLTSLNALTLCFKDCLKIDKKGIKSLCSGLRDLSELKSLNLNFSHCNQELIQGSGSLCHGLQDLVNLKSLVLNFSRFTINDFALNELYHKVLKNLAQLSTLSLDFSFCDKITDNGIDNLFSGELKCLDSLTSLDLNFSSSTGITDKGIKSLISRGLKHLGKLTHLSLDFSFCSHITNQGIDFLWSKDLKYLAHLISLNLSFEGCEGITDKGINSLCSKGLSCLSRLEQLSLNFGGCSKITPFTMMIIPRILTYFGFEII